MRSFSGLLGLLLLFGLGGCSAARPPAAPAVPDGPPAKKAAADLLDTPLPSDPDVRMDTLANGLRYYIRANGRPADRAELRLAVDAGSLLEDDDQRGLAHVVEHLAFNGTEGYPGPALVRYLESIGMRLGPDLNAYTSFDETVYLLQVPTDSLALLETGIDILREWAGAVVFDEAEIEKERGVVIEEWRGGRGASARIRDAQFPILLQGSRYADRLPIGTEASLRDFAPEALRRFYRDWYRPDLMAVIAVGDFDPDQVEAWIREQFGDLVSPEAPRPRPRFDAPPHEETLIARTTDPEANNFTVTVVYKHPAARQPATRAGYRQQLVEALYHSLLNTRLSELTQDEDPPFVVGFSGPGSFVRDAEFYTLATLAREGQYLRALETVLTEAERVRRHGFTAPELQRAKAQLLRAIERSYNERDKTASNRLATRYLNHFLTDTPIPGMAYAYEATQALLPGITVAELDALANRWIRDTNRVILVDGPEDPPLPTEAELLAVFDRVTAQDLAPYAEEVVDAPLLAVIPPSTPIEASETDSLGITRLQLANGVRVVMKPTDFKNDEVRFSAYSPGGTSLVPDSLYIPATFAAPLIGQSGVGAFGPLALPKKLAGQVVSVSPSLGARAEGFSGMATPQDLETLFQLIYLYATAPRADSTAFTSYRTRVASFLANRDANPEAAFRDTLQLTMAQYHPRARPFTQATLDAMDLQASLAIYQDRFADFSDFTFYFVGAFASDSLTALAARYLGALPSIGREEEGLDLGIRPPTGVVKKTVEKGLEPKSQVQLAFTGEAEWSMAAQRLLQATGQVLETQLRDVLREELGGTYGVGVGTRFNREPYAGYQVTISFGTDPERVDEMISRVFAQIDSLQQTGPTLEALANVREQTLRRLERNLQENGYWLSLLSTMDRTGLPAADFLDGPQVFMDALTPEDVREAAQRFLNPNQYVQVVLRPAL